MKNDMLVLLIFVFMISYCIVGKTQNMDKELDSLLRAKTRENLNAKKFPLTTIEHENIVVNYNNKKDSTFLININDALKNQPKHEVINAITTWLKGRHCRSFDSTWHKVMLVFYDMDRKLAKEFCNENILVNKCDYYDGEFSKYINLERVPYAKFLYDQYPLVESLPIIAEERGLTGDLNKRFVYWYYNEIKILKCQNNKECIEKINNYLKSYFFIEEKVKPNVLFMKALEDGKVEFGSAPPLKE